MSVYLNILVFILFTYVTAHANGLQLRISKSQISSEIEQPTISSVYKDSTGILWVGTQSGLYRFDGANLKNFDSNPSNENWIPPSGVSAIGESFDGNLLVATYLGGLLRWNWRTSAFEPVRPLERIKNLKLVRMLVDKQGNIWLGTKENVVLYDPKFDVIADWLEHQGLATKIGRPLAFHESDSGNIFIGGSLGLVEISVHEKLVTKIELGSLNVPSNFGVTAIETDKEGKIYVGTDTGHLASIDLKSGTLRYQLDMGDDSSKFISDILLYEDKVFVATDRGLYVSDSDFSFFKDIGSAGMGLSDPDVQTLLIDGNYVWIGTLNGLDLMYFAPFELFNFRNSGVFNDVMAFAEDRRDVIWIGTYSGLYFYDGAMESHRRFDSTSGFPPLVDQRVTTLSTKGAEVWIGFFRGGVQVFNTVSGDLSKVELPNSNELAVTKIVTTEWDDTAWVATYEHGLFRVNGSETYSYLEHDVLVEKSITTIFMPTTGALLAVAVNKVYQYDLKTDSFSEIKFDFGLNGEQPSINSISQSNNENLLIGTSGHGLFVWSQENQLKKLPSLESANRDSALANSTIYGIEEDSAGNLWCSTQNGVVKLKENGELIKRFTTTDGLQGTDFNVGASFESRNGQIYFGGASGYNRFLPHDITTETSPSPMLLTGITLPGKNNQNLGSVTDLESLQLTHKDHFVTFQFSVLDFIHPGKSQFRYKLNNFDNDWIENGPRNTATYTNLPAGDYELRVQGANSAGIWNREGLSLNVHVLPPPWKTWWAYCFYALGTILAFWAVLRIYRSYAIDRQSVQVAKEMFEAENRADDDMQEQLELQDELIRSAYKHNLETLSLVSDCISYSGQNHTEGVTADIAEGSVKRIAALSCLEECLYYQVGGPAANLQEYTDSIISSLLKNSPISPETIITINEMPSRLVPAQLASPLAVVLYELLENCIQHAFEPDSPANYIHITMDSKPADQSPGRRIDLTVRDNGAGMTGSLEDYSHENSGMAIVQAIVDKLNGELRLAVGEGTTITVTIPDPIT